MAKRIIFVKICPIPFLKDDKNIHIGEFISDSRKSNIG